MSRGILDFVGLAVTTAFAAPLVLAGVELLANGEHLLGGALFAIAVLMFVFEEYVVSPKDLPATILQKVTGTVAVEDENEEE